jgi:hypothetical protein
MMADQLTDYEIGKREGLTEIDRWGKGKDHHFQSRRLMKFLMDHDFNDYGDYFYWKIGGDGDNGETLMYQLDAFFETIDYLKKINYE